jgi:hypothetical protein
MAIVFSRADIYIICHDYRDGSSDHLILKVCQFFLVCFYKISGKLPCLFILVNYLVGCFLELWIIIRMKDEGGSLMADG